MNKQTFSTLVRDKNHVTRTTPLSRYINRVVNIRITVSIDEEKQAQYSMVFQRGVQMETKSVLWTSRK